MSEIQDNINDSTLEVTENMIKATIIEDWEEYFNELGMNEYATCKRIIMELGSCYSIPKNKLITLTMLSDLVKEVKESSSEDTTKAAIFICDEMTNLVKMVDKNCQWNRRN